MADSFPLYLPPESTRLFTGDEFVRRVGKVSHWGQGSRVLELAGSAASFFAARELGCDVVTVEADTRGASYWVAQVAGAGLSEKITVTKAPFNALPFAEGDFEGIAIFGRVVMPLQQAVSSLRRLLVQRGRLTISWPVKVGRTPHPAAVEFWEKRVGMPLMSPRDTLMSCESFGYEPETIETPSEPELEAHYRELATLLPKLPPGDAAHLKVLTEEINLHKQYGQRSGVSLAAMVLRRKEPGERPPPARDGG